MNNSTSRALPISVGALVILLVGLLWMRSRAPETGSMPDHASAATNASASTEVAGANGSRLARASKPSGLAATAEEVVAGKLKQFAISRREMMRAMAKQKNVAVHPLVERFFDAVESGDWVAVKAAFAEINGGEANAGHSPNRLPEVVALWAPIIDTYGAAEQVHLWPAQKLLDYGNAILDQLKPGMVYVGGTDEGRWVPTLLNETSQGERHIVLTQNALADGTYLDYLRFLYGDRLSALSSDDSQRAFQEYMADARKRMTHDEQFPNEPKQVRPGEEIKMIDNKISVSGQIAVMDINERLLRTLMEKNPELSFALQESFPLKGTYGEAAPLGPIMELRASDQASFTAERAAESVGYWRTIADQLQGSPDLENPDTASKSFSKLAVGQANLFAQRGFMEQAEETYRIALGMRASNTDAALGLAGLLESTGRAEQARVFLEQFGRDHPKQIDALNKFRTRGSVNWEAPKQ
jgi:hypothetical protein